MFLVFSCGNSSFFGYLKLIFIKISGSADLLDLFHWQNLLVTAVLLNYSRVQAFNLNNKAATWLHAEPRLKIEIENIKKTTVKKNLNSLCYSIKYIPVIIDLSDFWMCDT